MNRVWTIAEISSQQIPWQLTLNAQTGLAEFSGGRCIDAMQIGVIQTVDPWLGVLELRDPANTRGRHRVISQALRRIHWVHLLMGAH